MKKRFLTLALACIGITASAQNIRGTWSGELDAGMMKLALMLHVDNDSTCRLDSPDQGAKDIAGQVAFISTDSILVKMPKLVALYGVLLAQNKLLGGDAVKDLTIEKLREMPQIKQSPWIQWFIDYDPQGDIAKITCPVMALNGCKDCQVVASQSVSALRRTLPPNKQNLIKQYDSLNHLFQHCQTGLPTEYGTIEETFSEEVIRDIITWVKQLK